MKLGLKLMIGLSIILLVVLSHQVKAEVTYSIHDDMIRLSNNYESYCINKTSGLQFGSDISLDCSKPLFTKNEICAEGSRPSGHFRYCFEEIPHDSYVITDEGEYINVTFNTQIGTSNNNIKLILNYHLHNNTGMLFQYFTVENNIRNSVKIPTNISYVMKDIDEDFNLIELEEGVFNLDETLDIYNQERDGFDVYADDKYFHLNYDPLINTSIYLKDRIINVTQQFGEIDEGSSKTISYSYFDPNTQCSSFYDVTNGSIACYGNQFYITGNDGNQIDYDEKTAFKFVARGNEFIDTSATRLNFCINSVLNPAPGYKIAVGLQYDDATKDNPNGTWIVNTTAEFGLNCWNSNFLEIDYKNINLTEGQEYWVVFDGGLLNPAGGAWKNIKYKNPSHKRIPYDFTDQPEFKVRNFFKTGAKWITDSDATPLFQLSYNDTNNLQEYNYVNPMGQVYDFSSYAVSTGNIWYGQKFRTPFSLNISKVGAYVSGSSDAVYPQHNLSFTISLEIPGFGIFPQVTGNITVNSSLFNSTTFQWAEANITDWYPLNYFLTAPNYTYILFLHCGTCTGVAGNNYRWQFNVWQFGLPNIPANSTFQGTESYFGISTTAGTNWIDFGVKNYDGVFRLHTTTIIIEEEITPMLKGLQVIANIPEVVNQNENRTFTIHLYNETSWLNDGTCHISFFNESVMYNDTNSSFIDNALTFNIPSYVFMDKGEYQYNIFCNTSTHAGFLDNKYYVTKLGQIPASSNFKIFIWAIFIFSLIGLIYMIFLTVFRFMEVNINIGFVLKSISLYLIFLVTYWLSQNFMINYWIETLSDGLLLPFGFLNVILPLIGFIVSFFVKFKQVNKVN